MRQALTRRLASAAVGSSLPSVRELVDEHHVSPVTVHRVLRELARDGLVVARPGVGTFVAPRPQASSPGRYDWQALALGAQRVDPGALGDLVASPPAGALILASGYFDEGLQPLPLLAAAMTRAARRPGAWSRQPVEGSPVLRAWFAKQLGPGFGEEQVMIVSGGQAGLALVFRALAGPMPEPLLVDAPTYIGAVTAARAAGFQVLPVPSDQHGVLPDALERAFAATGARVYYTQPVFANPSAASLAGDRRARVLDIVARAGAFLVEDDPFRHLAIDGQPARPLVSDDPDGHVIYLASLTKCAAPGLRVAAVCARGAVLARLRGMRSIDDFFVAGVLQEAALEAVASAGWNRHLARVRRVLRERRDALCAALARELPEVSFTRPAGGLHVWARLPAELDDVELAQRARAAGVIVSPGRGWFPAEPPAPFLRLSYGACEPERLSEGVRLLARAARARRA